MKYKASFRNSNKSFRTNFYESREAAQDALMKRIGWFNYLGTVVGDMRNPYLGYCDIAARNGGSVDIDRK